MNLYEHTIIARQDISPSQIKSLKEKYSKLIEEKKGNLVQTQEWGLLNLSYLIKKNKKGNYIHFKIKGDGGLIKELEKNERIDKNLLRYVTIRVKKFDLEENYFGKEEDEETKKGKKKQMKSRKNNSKKGKSSSFSKLSIFQPNKYKFKKSCPLSVKNGIMI